MSVSKNEKRQKRQLCVTKKDEKVVKMETKMCQVVVKIRKFDDFETWRHWEKKMMKGAPKGVQNR